MNYSGIQCFIAEFDEDIKGAATPDLRRELLTKAKQRARGKGFSEDEINYIHVILVRGLRRKWKRGTPGRKQPLKNKYIKKSRD